MMWQNQYYDWIGDYDQTKTRDAVAEGAIAVKAMKQAIPIEEDWIGEANEAIALGVNAIELAADDIDTLQGDYDGLFRHYVGLKEIVSDLLENVFAVRVSAKEYPEVCEWCTENLSSYSFYDIPQQVPPARYFLIIRDRTEQAMFSLRWSEQFKYDIE